MLICGFHRLKRSFFLISISYFFREKKAIIFTYDNPNEFRSWTGTSIVRIYEGGSIEFDIYHMARGGLYSLIIRYIPSVRKAFLK